MPLLPDALLALVFSLLDVASWLTSAKRVCRSWRKVRVPQVALNLPLRATSLERACETLVPSALTSLVLRRYDLLYDDVPSISILPNLTSLNIACDEEHVDQTLMDILGRSLTPLTNLRRFGLEANEDVLKAYYAHPDPAPREPVQLPFLPFVENARLWGMHVDGVSLSSWQSLRELDLDHASMTTADLAITVGSLTQLEVLCLPYLPFLNGRKDHWRGSNMHMLRELAASSQGGFEEEDHEIFGDMVQAAAACLQVVKLGPNRLSGTVLVSLEACPRLVTLVRQFEQGSRFADAFCSPRSSFQALQHLALPCSDMSLQQFVWTFGAARLRELNVDSSTHLSLADLRPWMKFLRD